jgi:hypothetical protein
VCVELIALGKGARQPEPLTTPLSFLLSSSSASSPRQVESLTIATVCDKTYLFVGAERTSTIFVFDITVRLAHIPAVSSMSLRNSPRYTSNPETKQDPTNTTLESHISAAGDVTKKPSDVFALDPEPRPNTGLGQVCTNACWLPDVIDARRMIGPDVFHAKCRIGLGAPGLADIFVLIADRP